MNINKQIIWIFLICLLSNYSKAQDYNIPKDAFLHTFTSDMQKALITTKNGEVQLWDFEQQTAIYTLMQDAQRLRLAAFSPDSKKVLINKEGNEAELWQVKNTNLLAMLEAHEYDILNIDFSINGAYMATAGQDQKIVLWDSTGKKIREWEASPLPVRVVAFSPDNQVIASGGVDKLITIWNFEGKEQNKIQGHQSDITALYFSNDGQRLYSASKDSTLKIWNRNGKEIKNVWLHFVPTRISTFENEHILVWENEEKMEVVDKDGNFVTGFVISNEDKPKRKPKTYSETIKGIAFDFVLVEGGSFSMGREDGFDWEKPVHQVAVNDFYMGRYEVTQAQWEAVMGYNPSKFNDCANCPVEQVSWLDCQVFIDSLRSLTGKIFRLPSEAEWEYAAAGANPIKAYQYAGNNNLENIAWYGTNSEKKTQPVGKKRPNELGIYDMSGNVWEWCLDEYKNNTYTNTPHNFENPVLKDKLIVRLEQGMNFNDRAKIPNTVQRGGSWYDTDAYCAIGFRYYANPKSKNPITGLRLIYVSE